MDDNITIIEGPTPIFEKAHDDWIIGVNESSHWYELAVTKLRTFSGAALLERCHRTWDQKSTMFLHYKNRIGMEDKVPIIAARSQKTEDGEVLILWVRRRNTESQKEQGFFDDENNEAL